MEKRNKRPRTEFNDYFRMDPHQLGRSQLAYELQLRQCIPEGTARKQADAVKAMLAHEQQDGTDLVHLDHSPLAPDEDLNQCEKLAEVLEAHMSIGRVDYNTLRAVWSQATHLIERLRRIRTAGAEMTRKRESLTHRAVAARLEAERQRDPFQSPPTATATTAQSGAQAQKPMAAVAGTAFQQAVQATPDYPPVTSTTDVVALAARLSQIFTAPEPLTVTTANSSVVQPPNAAAAITEIGQNTEGGGAVALSAATTLHTTTDYRENPDGFHVSDVDDDDESFVPRPAAVTEHTSPDFRMRGATLTVPPTTIAGQQTTTCTGAIPKRTGGAPSIAPPTYEFPTPLTVIQGETRPPRTIFVTATTTPIPTHLYGPGNAHAHTPTCAAKSDHIICFVTGHAVPMAHVVSFNPIKPGSPHKRNANIHGPNVSAYQYASKLVAIPSAVADSQRIRHTHKWSYQ